jgi:TRAP-type mannitol/chloroaromatic compound transport system permease large subunit
MRVSRRELWLRFWKVVVPPIMLVVSVLGSIVGGIAAPTEAASMGAVGAILITVAPAASSGRC